MEPQTQYMCCICDENTIVLTKYKDSSAPISLVSLVSGTHREMSKMDGNNDSTHPGQARTIDYSDSKQDGAYVPSGTIP